MKLSVGVGVVVALFILTFSNSPWFVPTARASSSASLTPVAYPLPGHAFMKDPSGTYNFTYLGDREYSTDSATYQRLLHYPYSGTTSLEQALGSSVLMIAPEVNLSGATNARSHEWSGAGGGYCSSFGLVGSGNDQAAVCNNPSDTLFYSAVSVDSLTWMGHCFNAGGSCITAFWTGLSPADTSQNPLVQSGITVCHIAVSCNGYGSKGDTSWFMWWEILPTYPTSQPIPQYPTNINGTSESYLTDFYYDNTHVTFQWNVGSWYYVLTVKSQYQQSNFYVAEGIFEAPLILGCCHEGISLWSPNSAIITDKYQGVNHYPSYGYVGTSYTSFTYTLYSSQDNIEATGAPLGPTTYPAYWYCGPQHC